jgi:N-acetylglucosamine transport system substrate-binding protein
MNSDIFGQSGVSRRAFLRRAAAAGVLVVPAGAVLSACATSGGGGNQNVGTTKKSTSNPLGVKPDAPLDVFIFKGGYGDDYAKYDESLYSKAFPKAKVHHSSGQQLGQTLQPRFVGGNPPDVIDNSGAGNLDVATLVAKGQIQDLSAMFNSPSVDDPNTTVKDSLLPGVYDSGLFSGKPFILNYVYTVNAIWYSKTLFAQKGWEYPKTWDDMLALCAKIKKSGISPWTFQGKYPYYILNPILSMAAKTGGQQVLTNLDNLEPNAWKAPSVKAAATAFHELVSKGYILPGTPGLTHTQSQTYWAQGKAAFIPCGSWLENELGSITPKNFDMVVAPTPSLTTSDKLPFTAVWAAAGEGFIVPSDGKNPTGGADFMRIMLGKQASTNFSKQTHSLTALKGYAENLNYSTAFTSAREVVTAAGNNTLNWFFGTWYAKMETNVENATGALMAGQIGPDEWVTRCQKAADETAQDSSIKKYKR